MRTVCPLEDGSHKICLHSNKGRVSIPHNTNIIFLGLLLMLLFLPQKLPNWNYDAPCSFASTNIKKMPKYFRIKKNISILESEVLAKNNFESASS